jgi:hypothetical protein
VVPDRPRHSAANVPSLVYGAQAEENRALFLAAAGSASDPDVVAREIGKAIRAMGLKTCYLVDPNANEWRQLRDNRFNKLSPNVESDCRIKPHLGRLQGACVHPQLVARYNRSAGRLSKSSFVSRNIFGVGEYYSTSGVVHIAGTNIIGKRIPVR